MTVKYCFYTFISTFQSGYETGRQVVSLITNNGIFSYSDYPNVDLAVLFICGFVRRASVRIFRVGFVPLKTTS